VTIIVMQSKLIGNACGDVSSEWC